ncbi:protein of unknown function DUF1555 [Geobacter metallireducens RCH3]|uniref:PEP motif-containing protein, putative exosortase substrate n=1 Tax=Geobacter metallireducens (strain ATCC 53774 / DSM 7210 / GS-15) TaxID=269799 RepID=Q39SH1_GEOMG|nr:PEP-CTERM sorting domain-containing protein [Geobacter metallireducens]ABB32803.1 PEP motif-containing protein, putative exosortase substrate [Geobacter metallireducens GS-15]EHP86087.1 protein of unknown function DUF1555 [Geobacter metallireducens RCH3]
MKEHMMQAVTGLFCGLALLAQASVSWGVTLMTENSIDTISFSLPTNAPNAPLSITYGDFESNVSGRIYDNTGALVASGAASNTGSFNGAIDGSIGSSVPVYSTSNRFARVNSATELTPLIGNPDPLADPLNSIFTVIGSTMAGSLGGHSVRAMDSAQYLQFLNVNGTGTGALTASANYIYTFTLGVSPFGEPPFTTNGMTQVHFEMGTFTGSILNYVLNPLVTFDSPLFSMSLLDMADPLNGMDILNLFTSDPLTVNGGSSYYFLARANTDTAVNSVPEPGTIMLVGSGLLGVFLFRKRITGISF